MRTHYLSESTTLPLDNLNQESGHQCNVAWFAIAIAEMDASKWQRNSTRVVAELA
jgi:hypothetical protein